MSEQRGFDSCGYPSGQKTSERIIGRFLGDQAAPPVASFPALNKAAFPALHAYADGAARVLGTLPLTADDVPFAMGANLFRLCHPENGQSVIEVGVLKIIDPEDTHPDEYPKGQRWEVHYRSTDGDEDWGFENTFYSTRDAAAAALKAVTP